MKGIDEMGSTAAQNVSEGGVNSNPDRSDGAEPIVSVRNVYKIFGRKPEVALEQLQAGTSRDDIPDHNVAAVIDANFDVYPGEIFVVMGLSGSGKSTLIRTLNALQPATSGTVMVKGQDLSTLDKAELRKVRKESMSMVFQHFALFPHWTVLENAAYGLEIRGVPKKERMAKAEKILDAVGLKGWSDKYPSELSGGMQQRVGLGRALASGNDILLMDEAFSALDPLIRREMQNELVNLQKELGRTIIFITHDLNEAMYMGDRIAVMKDGRIAQIGTPEEILAHPADDYVASFTADVDRSRVLTAESVMVPQVEMSESELKSANSGKISTVRPGATLQEIVPVAVEADGPLAVESDEGGRHVRVGYIRVEKLLEAMAVKEQHAEQQRLSETEADADPASSIDPTGGEQK